MLTFTAQGFIREEALKISYFVCKKPENLEHCTIFCKFDDNSIFQLFLTQNLPKSDEGVSMS